MTKLGDREIPPQTRRFGNPVEENGATRYDDLLVTGVLFRHIESGSGPCLIRCETHLEGEHDPVFAFSYIHLTLTFGDELIGQTFGAVRRQFRERDIAQAAKTVARPYSFTLVTTAMPVQAVGRTTDGRSYYFWARHGRWTLHIGRPEWPTDPAAWPTGALTTTPDAEGGDDTNGHMTEAQVRAVLDRHLLGPNHA